jgi:hypothetical protein
MYHSKPRSPSSLQACTQRIQPASSPLQAPHPVAMLSAKLFRCTQRGRGGGETPQEGSVVALSMHVEITRKERNEENGVQCDALVAVATWVQ